MPTSPAAPRSNRSSIPSGANDLSAALETADAATAASGVGRRQAVNGLPPRPNAAPSSVPPRAAPPQRRRGVGDILEDMHAPAHAAQQPRHATPPNELVRGRARWQQAWSAAWGLPRHATALMAAVNQGLNEAADIVTEHVTAAGQADAATGAHWLQNALLDAVSELNFKRNDPTPHRTYLDAARLIDERYFLQLELADAATTPERGQEIRNELGSHELPQDENEYKNAMDELGHAGLGTKNPYRLANCSPFKSTQTDAIKVADEAILHVRREKAQFTAVPADPAS
jgi:hypothetical protein